MTPEPWLPVGEPIDPATVRPVSPGEFVRRAVVWDAATGGNAVELDLRVRGTRGVEVSRAWIDDVEVDPRTLEPLERVVGWDAATGGNAVEVGLPQRPRSVCVVEGVLGEVRRLLAEVRAVVDSPTAYRAADGSVAVEWQDGARYALVSRELLTEIVLELNERRQP